MALHKLCTERKAANLERWRKFGDNKCGLSEAIIRGAVTPGGVKANDTATAAPTEERKVVDGAAPSAPARETTEAVEQPPTAPVPVAELEKLSLSDEKKADDFVDAPVASLETVAAAAPAVHA